MGQANDALGALRLELGYKSIVQRVDVRRTTHRKGKTRAWKRVNNSAREVRKYERSYNRARRALQQLGADAKILEKFKEIENKDLVVAPDMVEENRVGQKSDTMPWFWRLGPESQSDTENAGWMEECECDYCKVWRVIDIYSW